MVYLFGSRATRGRRNHDPSTAPHWPSLRPQRLYFTDYGLALSSRFDLAPRETAFYDRHRGYDRCYALSHLVNWLLKDLYDHDRDEREARMRAYAQGERPTGIPDTAAAIITRYAPLATVMATFFRRLGDESRQTPYPLEELRRCLAPLPKS